MKQINAGVNMDISFQMYSNLHFMDWKWLNMPYIACKTNADIESMFGTCLYHEICIKKRMLTPSKERWAAHPPPPAFPLAGVYLHSIFPFTAVVRSFWRLQAPQDCILLLDDHPMINRRAIRLRTDTQPSWASQLQHRYHAESFTKDHKCGCQNLGCAVTF